MTDQAETYTDSRVLRWVITADDEWHPIGPGPVLHVACRPGDVLGAVHVWTLENDSTQGLAPRGVRIFGTGHPLTSDTGRHLGSGITTDGSLVWHVFERQNGDRAA